MRQRLPGVFALALPVLAGAAWMLAAGAPLDYPLINLAALALVVPWILLGHGPHTATSRTLLFLAILGILLAPLVTGPAMGSSGEAVVMRWVKIGPVTLHSGMLGVPPLVVLVARNRRYGAAMLLAAVFAVSLQPDAATGFALTFAAFGIHHLTEDWKFGVAAILAFVASLAMATSGQLLPQPFVERVLADAAAFHPVMAALLFASLLAAFLLFVFTLPLSREKRFAVGGALFGFAIMAVMAHYPMPLLGFGAAPILGFGIALGLNRIPRR